MTGRGAGPDGAVRHVVFDWNGTLLDDCALAVETVNALRAGSGLAVLTKADYRRAFRFPIAEFYRSIGFDLEREDFPALMRRYLTLFDAKVDLCPLHDGAREIVGRLRASALGVHILSASHEQTLLRSLRAKELASSFDEVAGLHHELAASKQARGSELAATLAADPTTVLYVGDTDHDYEVATALGWQFLFVDHGHQAAVADAPHCARVVERLEQIADFAR